MQRRTCLKWMALGFGGFAGLPVSPMTLAMPQTVQRIVRMPIRFANPTTETLGPQRVWIYAPAAVGPTQRLSTLNVSMNSASTNDPFGNRVIEFAIPGLPAYAIKTVQITAELTLTDEPMPENLEQVDRWLNSERYIETESAEIAALAERLKASTPRESAARIFDWVATNVRYTGFDPSDRGALFALQSRQGDCTEFAYLAVALARACGIPARLVGGYVTDRSLIVRASDYHNWAEVYVDGAWRLLDAQKGRWLAPAEQYIAFRYGSGEAANPIGSAHRFRAEGAITVEVGAA